MTFKKIRDKIHYLFIQLTFEIVSFLLICLVICLLFMNLNAGNYINNRLNIDLASITNISRYLVVEAESGLQIKDEHYTNQILRYITIGNSEIEEIAVLNAAIPADKDRPARKMEVLFGTYNFSESKDTRNIRSAIEKNETIVTDIHDSNNRILRKNIIPINDEQVVIVVLNENSANQLKSGIRNYLIIIFGAAIILTTFWIVFSIRRRLAPIADILIHVKKVTNGDLSGKISLNSKNELDNLADGINVMTISMKKMVDQINKEAQEDLKSTEQIYRRELQSLLLSVDSSRHDIRNHMNVLHGMMQMGSYEEVKMYMDQLYEDYAKMEVKNIRTVNPAIGVLILNKATIAENLKIRFESDIGQDNFDLIKSTDLIKILSNLIDNAIDAVKTFDGSRVVGVKISKKTTKYYEIVVWNTGKAIPDEIQDRMFEPGFTTKELSSTSLSQSRGHGLAIVEKVINKYDGEIMVESSDKQTIFSILVPVDINGIKKQ
ncbi:sensor histidine kinase [Paenibacillus sp. Leaf72]|uniref:sensor histidine kinase n=1 Tax=Paenibacillus sp. Leaf72 TaxID=1736234 RepID=UPI0006FF9D61|nr:ATP-binding protein [Paenibacillus sp. Leaf72]KQN96984.1 hypothetical protein ASF12_23230 [Paenibacillus sp. Leaf72]